MVPPRYTLRFYPDITHSMLCPFPVPDWDFAFGTTQHRETINPRPVDQAAIFRLLQPSAEHGFLTYSEGCNDDVKKFVWSGLGWDPDLPVIDILRDYSCYFLGAEHAEGFAPGLLALERNWRAPPEGEQRGVHHPHAVSGKGTFGDAGADRQRPVSNGALPGVPRCVPARAPARGGSGAGPWRLPRSSWRFFERGSFLPTARAAAPLEMIYRGLDPKARYRLRVIYAPEKLGRVALTANERFALHPLMEKTVQTAPLEFEIPAEATAGGELRLAWTGSGGGVVQMAGRRTSSWAPPAPN